MSILNYLVKERDSLNVRLMKNLSSKHIVMYCLMLTQSLLFKSKCSIASELNTLLDTFYDNPLFYYREHKRLVKGQYRARRLPQYELQKIHCQNFTEWFKKRVLFFYYNANSTTALFVRRKILTVILFRLHA